MSKTYNVTREVASKSLNISTRTIDRYIKSGKLSYKKIANKVLLAKEEVLALKQEFATLHQELNTEIINQSNTSNNTGIAHKNDLEDAIDQKVEKFFLIFKEKEKMLEEKNKVIFVLQQRVSELESKIQHMIALPDYNKEKQEAIIEKQKLEEKIGQLKGMIKNEKLKNLIFIGLSLIFIIVAGFFIFQG
ncbi:MAG TPA: helix-turn-helix domain-containing protein [Candidatus Absconditabacterales bacterium]|nr:helix-turn-helix domain-containing protein [Candidatus Absconditabacterales bacterium]